MDRVGDTYEVKSQEGVVEVFWDSDSVVLRAIDARLDHEQVRALVVVLMAFYTTPEGGDA